MPTTAADIEALRTAAAERGREHDRAVARREQAEEALARVDEQLRTEFGCDSADAARAALEALDAEIEAEAERVRQILTPPATTTETTQ